MDRKLPEKANELDSELRKIEVGLDRIRANAQPSHSLKVEVDQCYGDFARSYVNSILLTGETAVRVYHVIIEELEKIVADMTRQLEAL